MYALLKPYAPIDSANPTDRRRRKLAPMRIAYTETMTGLRDDIPTLMFLAPMQLLIDVCQHIYKLMNGKVADMTISLEHGCRPRNGKSYWRNVVRIVGLDETFISFSEFTQLLLSRMRSVCNCTIKHYRTETFINI